MQSDDLNERLKLHELTDWLDCPECINDTPVLKPFDDGEVEIQCRSCGYSRMLVTGRMEDQPKRFEDDAE